MVMLSQLLILLAAAEPVRQPLWLRLDPSDRVRVLAALAALLILGFALIIFAWWAARYTRRYMDVPARSSRDASGRPHVDDWASKPLVEDDDLSARDD
jgi:hypothetical protein